MKKILKTILIFLLIIAFWGVSYGATQKYVILEANETKYIDPYEITNDTDKKIFAPYTDNSEQVLWNIKERLDISTWEKSFSFMWNKSIDFKTYSQNKFSFDSMQKLNNTFTIWWFSVKDATYSWNEWDYWSCSETCWGWNRVRTISCKRWNWAFMDEKYCNLWSKWIESESCNTHACYVTTCNSSNLWKKNASWQTCKVRTESWTRYSWCKETRYKNWSCASYNYYTWKLPQYYIDHNWSCWDYLEFSAEWVQSLSNNRCKTRSCSSYNQVAYEADVKCNFRPYTKYFYYF